MKVGCTDVCLKVEEAWLKHILVPEVVLKSHKCQRLFQLLVQGVKPLRLFPSVSSVAVEMSCRLVTWASVSSVPAAPGQTPLVIGTWFVPIQVDSIGTPSSQSGPSIAGDWCGIWDAVPPSFLRQSEGD